jgi:hypothetical protein
MSMDTKLRHLCDAGQAAAAAAPKRPCLGSGRRASVLCLATEVCLLHVVAMLGDADLPALMAAVGLPALDVLLPRDFWRWRVAAHPERAALCAALLAPLLAPGGSVGMCRVPRDSAVEPRRAAATAPARGRVAYLSRPRLGAERCECCDAVTKLSVSHHTEFICPSFQYSKWDKWRTMYLAADDVSCDACVREHGVRASHWPVDEYEHDTYWAPAEEDPAEEDPRRNDHGDAELEEVCLRARDGPHAVIDLTLDEDEDEDEGDRATVIVEDSDGDRDTVIVEDSEDEDEDM